MTGPATDSRVMAISPGTIRATSPIKTIRVTSRSARISEPQGSDHSTSRIRLPSASGPVFPCPVFPCPVFPCSLTVTSRHRKPDRNTAPSRLTVEVDTAPATAEVTSARSSKWSAARSTATVTADTTIETTRIRQACRRAVCTTATAIGRNRSVWPPDVMTRHGT
jgi:hypothetical protein